MLPLGDQANQLIIGGEMETWTCHICGERRPDDKISVVSKPVVLNGRVVGEQNIRYCNDNPECAEKARAHTHFQTEYGKYGSAVLRGVSEAERGNQIYGESRNPQELLNALHEEVGEIQRAFNRFPEEETAMKDEIGETIGVLLNLWVALPR